MGQGLSFGWLLCSIFYIVRPHKHIYSATLYAPASAQTDIQNTFHVCTSCTGLRPIQYHFGRSSSRVYVSYLQPFVHIQAVVPSLCLSLIANSNTFARDGHRHRR
jgi:hypothetical protein